MDSDQDHCSVGPDLGSNWLQRLSADDKASPLAGKEVKSLFCQLFAAIPKTYYRLTILQIIKTIIKLLCQDQFY